MKTLTREDERLLQQKKLHNNLTNDILSTMLGMTQEALFMASLGHPVPVDVYDAIMEWIEQ